MGLNSPELKSQTLHHHPVEAEFAPSELYPKSTELVKSLGNTTYYVDPVHGNDRHLGTDMSTAWKSLAPVNRLSLASGDSVTILPGPLNMTLMPTAIGSKEKPVTIRFTSGRHVFHAELAAKLCYYISNSADAPTKPRPIGILIKGSRYLNIVGDQNSEIIYADRMTEFINDHSRNISYRGLTFDMDRPTVSEFRVVGETERNVEIQIAEGSTYSIEGSHFAWTGDLGPGWSMAQEAEPETGKCHRLGQWNPFANAKAEAVSPNLVRLEFAKPGHGMHLGCQYQFRNTERDTTSAANIRCQDIRFVDCRFHALPGMGIVSQFTQNITFERVEIVPRPGTIRTCPAWADCLHFSGCRGNVLIDQCSFSGTQDDPINVHGTFLQLVERVKTNQVLVRFMHPQTYGFDAFESGDDIAFVSHVTLRPYSTAKVRSIDRKTDKDWLLTFEGEVPHFAEGDVIDNVTWYPDLTVRRSTFTMDSCRGILVTTRGKVVIENNSFVRTEMSAIDIANDANSWYESGAVKNVTIRNNRFIQCGEPTIYIHPENQTDDPKLPVHENITITGNLFDQGAGNAIYAKSVKGLAVVRNRFSTPKLSIETKACTDVQIKDNLLGVKSDKAR